MGKTRTSFQKGQSGNPKGRKSKAEELGLTKLLDECFTEQDRRDVLIQLVNDAKSSDVRIRESARELLLAYTFGKPKQIQEVTGAHGKALTIRIVDDDDDRSTDD